MATSIFNRLVRSVVPPPNEAARAARHAKRAIEAWRELLSNRGAVSGAAVAQEALNAYHELPPAAREVFFTRLAEAFAPDAGALRAACEAWLADGSAENLAQLQSVSEPPLQRLCQRLNQTPGGTAALIDVGKHVLAGLSEHPEWQMIDTVLARLFQSWFNRGFLTLARIDWHTPAFVLEKLIEYEAVHEISGWRDLRRRLQSDRRCFGFFHPALPDEPLIFIEVALTKGIASAVQPLIAPDAPVALPEKADTAVFYSITNCQPGLRGVSFGNLLIKQVAQKLGEEFPRIRTFATLSPIPGFMSWLAKTADSIHNPAALAAISGLTRADWPRDTALADSMKAVLMPLCAHYLTAVMRDGEPIDAVARFHLGNGARAERLNWLADTSARGLRNCAGMMINYLYDLGDIEENHELYVREHQVAATHELRRLARDNVLTRSAAPKHNR